MIFRRGHRAVFLGVAGHGHQYAKTSLLLVSGPEGVSSGQIDYPVAGPGLWQLDGVVSRKKQLLPYLLQRPAGSAHCSRLPALPA